VRKDKECGGRGVQERALEDKSQGLNKDLRGEEVDNDELTTFTAQVERNKAGGFELFVSSDSCSDRKSFQIKPAVFNR